MAFQYGGLVEQVQTTATAAGTTTLVNTSKQIQIFTGSLSQTVVLPVATTMSVGQKFEIYNESAVAITIQFQDASAFADAGGTSYAVLPAHQSFIARLQTNATANGTWSVLGSGIASAGYSTVTPTVQKFLSGSGTYVPPSNVSYIEVEMVGGGGGGSGGGSASGSLATAGGASTFGSSLLSAGGGAAGIWEAQSASGGSSSLGTGPIGIALTGGAGAGYGITTNSGGGLYPSGGAGGASALGGAGTGGNANYAATAGQTNTGGGGGGGGSNSGTANVATGTGGGAGGYVKAIIQNPTSTYAYAVGAGGTAGGAGTNGTAGGAGGSGVIIITEYYANSIASGVTVTASTAPTKQIFLSGSGTYNRPNGVQYITVRMVGGGGGGAGGGVGAASPGGNGGNTAFGTSLLVANGGTGASVSSGVGGAGGTASLGTGPIGIALTGAQGGAAFNNDNVTGADNTGGAGGSSPLGGAGAAGTTGNAGNAAAANTGSGGGGGATSNVTNSVGGGGGGAGGYIECIIQNPSSTYSYSVGTGGTAGPAGTSGYVGAAGGSGIIEVTEYYTAYATGGFTGGGANVPTVQKFLSGSGTYTTPSNVTYIEVEMCGGGGGGGGSGTATGTAATSGGASTFGTSLLVANGGALGTFGSGGAQGGAGGTASLGTGPIGIALTGGIGVGGSGTTVVSTVALSGGAGGSNPLGGAGAGGWAANGTAGSANTGSGGGGAGYGSSSSQEYAGNGGGAGGYIKAIITNPNSTYSYAVGAGGTGGGAGTVGFAGGNGASGIIKVTEYYANGAVGTATNVTGIVAGANGGTGSSSFHGNYYASVYYPASGANYWGTTSSTLANFTTSGTIPTPTVRVNSNMGTIGVATSSLPGVSFTAPRTGTIKVTSRAFAYNNTACIFTLQLQETTTSTILDATGSGTLSQSTSYPSTMVGYLSVTAGTTYNIDLLGQTSAGTLYIANGNVSNLSFLLEYIN